jgi:hypothetical protein
VAKHLSRRWRVALLAGASVALLGVGLHTAVLRLPWFGPWLADSLRSVVGSRAVTALEQLWSDVEDVANRVLRARSKPRSLEQAQPALTQARPEAARAESEQPPRLDASEPAFRPRDVGSMHPQVAAKSDGEWQAVVDPAHPTDQALLFAAFTQLPAPSSPRPRPRRDEPTLGEDSFPAPTKHGFWRPSMEAS